MFLQGVGISSDELFLGVAIGSCLCWVSVLFMVPLALSEAEASVATGGSLVESFCRSAVTERNGEERGERAERDCGNMFEGSCLHQESVSRQRGCGERFLQAG